MPKNSVDPPPHGRVLASQVIDSDKTGKLAALTRRAARELAKLRRGVTDGDDAVTSAVRTLLRRQDPGAPVHHLSTPDPVITSECQVWILLEQHLARKLNTALAQGRQRRNAGVRLGDLRDEEAREAWMDAFVDGDGGQAHNDPEVVASYVCDLLRSLEEIVGEDSLLAICPDNQSRAILELKLTTLSQRKVAKQLGVTPTVVRGVIERADAAFHAAWAAEDNRA